MLIVCESSVEPVDRLLEPNGPPDHFNAFGTVGEDAVWPAAEFPSFVQ